MSAWVNVGAKEIQMQILGAAIEEYSIVVDDTSICAGPLEVSDYMQTAASQLQKYIAAITGITLPIVKVGNPLTKDCEILLGATGRYPSEEDMSALGDEGYRIFTRDKRLCFLGGKRGNGKRTVFLADRTNHRHSLIAKLIDVDLAVALDTDGVDLLTLNTVLL